MVLLVATEGQVRVNSLYQDKVSLPNYPAIPSDATLEIQNIRSNDSGIYRCEVMHGIEDSEATLEVIVKGEGCYVACRLRVMSSLVWTLVASFPTQPLYTPMFSLSSSSVGLAGLGHWGWGT